MIVRILHLAKRDAGEASVAAWVRSPGWSTFVPTLFLILSPICRLPVAQPVRLARLTIPGLNEAGQETESPEAGFESHRKVRIQPFQLRCKRAGSRDFFQMVTTATN